MKIVINVTKNFVSEAKPLLKKYPSLPADLKLLEAQLLINPATGISLGGGAYKIRVRIRSKGRGKSGGARVITFLENEIITEVNNEGGVVTVNLLSIYDKSEMAAITQADLKALIAMLLNENS